MAVPFKNGADLYNNEVLRMRLHNLGADPTEVGAGLIYFNTSNGLNTSKKARIYTGDAWKTFAFVEDLDVASNADFIALQEKVALLAGDVDTDAIISNMKEVSAFLEGFAEDASLMDLLNSKLSKSGGTITGVLTIKTNVDAKLILDNTDTDTGYSLIDFRQNGVSVGVLGILEVGSTDLAWRRNTLLHSGNIGSYKAGDSDMLGGLAASRYFLRNSSIASDTIDANTWGIFGFTRLASNGGAALNWPEAYGYALNYKGHEANRAGFQLFAKASGNSLLFRRHWDSWGDWKTIAFTDSNVASAQALVHSNGTVGATVVSSGRVDFSGNISLALGKSILDPTGRSIFAIDGNNSPQIGLDTCGSYSTYINGKDVYLRYGSSRTAGFILNSSGNVTIGASAAAGTSAKLHVDGNVRIGVDSSISTANWTGTLLIGADRHLAFDANDIQAKDRDGNPSALYINDWGGNVFLCRNGGNVLIGTTEYNGEKLCVKGNVRATEIFVGTESKRYGKFSWASTGTADLVAESGNILRLGVGSTRSLRIETDGLINLLADTTINGNLHVTGNIIADGEVSAGGAGEEGSASGSGAGAFHSESVAVGATQKTIAHGLGTDDIVVSIYEKDATSGLWSMILTDIEITDANNIRVTFGSATTVEHKVVIMGAVA